MAKIIETGVSRVALATGLAAADAVPVSTANPLPVTLSSSGTGASATQVQGTAAEAAASNTTNPVKVGGIIATGSGTPSILPTIAAAGNNASQRYTPQGASYTTLVDGGGFILTTNYIGGDSVGGFGPALKTYGANLLLSGATLTPQPGDASGAFMAANVFFTESTTALASSATLNGTLRANGGAAGGLGSRFAFFVAEAFSDVAGGTLYIDKSVDAGTTWRQVGSVALAANTSVSLKVPVSAPSYRVRVVNGATAQGAALVTSAYSFN